MSSFTCSSWKSHWQWHILYRCFLLLCPEPSACSNAPHLHPLQLPGPQPGSPHTWSSAYTFVSLLSSLTWTASGTTDLWFQSSSAWLNLSQSGIKASLEWPPAQPGPAPLSHHLLGCPSMVALNPSLLSGLCRHGPTWAIAPAIPPTRVHFSTSHRLTSTLPSGHLSPPPGGLPQKAT